MNQAEHLRAMVGQADQMLAAWKASLVQITQRPNDPVALDTFANQCAAVAATIGLVGERASQAAGAILEDLETGAAGAQQFPRRV